MCIEKFSFEKFFTNFAAQDTAEIHRSGREGLLGVVAFVLVVDVAAEEESMAAEAERVGARDLAATCNGQGGKQRGRCRGWGGVGESLALVVMIFGGIVVLLVWVVSVAMIVFQLLRCQCWC